MGDAGLVAEDPLDTGGSAGDVVADTDVVELPAEAEHPATAIAVTVTTEPMIARRTRPGHADRCELKGGKPDIPLLKVTSFRRASGKAPPPHSG